MKKSSVVRIDQRIHTDNSRTLSLSPNLIRIWKFMNITAAGRTLGTALLPLSEGEDKDSHILMTFTTLLDFQFQFLTHLRRSESVFNVSGRDK